jgi:hypothetical protein
MKPDPKQTPRVELTIAPAGRRNSISHSGSAAGLVDNRLRLRVFIIPSSNREH